VSWHLPDPLELTKRPAADRYCDLVLTGGVTDGIVYPWAVLELARQYRFKNIGGTSVGAMAAALTAAAEYGRRHGRLTGFNRVLRELPERLAQDIDGLGGKGRTRIFSLFQPGRRTRRLFDLFVRLLGSGRFSVEGAAAPIRERDLAPEVTLSAAKPPSFPGSTWLARLYDLYSVYWGHAMLGAFLGLLGSALAWRFGAHPGWAFLLALPAIAFCSLGVVAIRVGLDVVRLKQSHFGMCTGYRGEGVPDSEPSLVEWLHEGIQAAAGLALDQPLTFHDLWQAPGGPVAETDLPLSRRTKTRSIDLRMITTNLSHARPYEFPQEPDDTRLFFKPSELRPFFPPEVIDHLIAHSEATGLQGFRTLPREHLPVLVAARLSLSFPLLFGAIPLWAIDHERDGGFTRCRFSDGGICSNFPIHLFDAAVPEWPTFGISLISKTAERKQVWVSEHHLQGRHDAWYRFDETMSLGGFLAAIAYSAKDWNDKTAVRMPGVRDRVAHIALHAGGTLNLKLTSKDMETLANLGQQAGLALVDKFVRRNGWAEHRWVRFHTFLSGLRERIEMIREATRRRLYGQPIAEQIEDARHSPPLSGPGEKTVRDPQAEDLQALLAMLTELEEKFAQAALPQPYEPLPKPSLHIRAPL
jgi:predicted acylesterase/phospholipase RssA